MKYTREQIIEFMAINPEFYLSVSSALNLIGMTTNSKIDLFLILINDEKTKKSIKDFTIQKIKELSSNNEIFINELIKISKDNLLYCFEIDKQSDFLKNELLRLWRIENE